MEYRLYYGDASYAVTVKEQKASKGLQVESLQLWEKNILSLHHESYFYNCGYLEQWTGSKLDDTGKQQSGNIFDPFKNGSST